MNTFNQIAALLMVVTGALAQSTTPALTPAQTQDLQPVSRELDPKSLKLKMPVGVDNNTFDLSDSARKAMISSPAMLETSNQIQLSKQDSVTMRGLMELPIASLSEVVSKQDYYTQLRFLRFGLLEIQSRPETARLYAAKLYILTDEIFPRKAALDSLMRAATLERSRQQTQPVQRQPDTTVPAPSSQPESSGSVLPLLTVLLLATGGAYYWFVLRKKQETTESATQTHVARTEKAATDEVVLETALDKEDQQPAISSFENKDADSRDR